MGPMVYVLAFLAAFLAVEGIHELVRSRRSGDPARTRRRLRELASHLRAPGPESGGEQGILRERERRKLLAQLVGVLPRGRRIELALYRAGLALSLQRFLGLSAAIGLLGYGLGLLFLEDPAKSLPLLGLGIAPWLQVRRMESRRMVQFERQFPDALDMITRVLRAGHSLTFGLQMVGQELAEPIGTEFTQVSEEIKLGQDARDALASLAWRTQSPDVAFFVTAILIQRESGGNLAEVLENLAAVIRERLKLYGKVRSITGTARASANLLAVWPVVTVAGLQLTNPEYVAPLWKTGAGNWLLIVSAVLVVVGYVLCRRLARIEV
jgi:tight adherence protein B